MSHLEDLAAQEMADGTLPAARSCSAKAHCDVCPECTALVADYRSLASDLAAMSEPPTPLHFTAGVMARVDVHARDLAAESRVAIVTLVGAASVATTLLLLAGSGEWARQLSVWAEDLARASLLTQLAANVVGPLASALRLEILVICAAVCLPVLVALQHLIPARTLPASS